METYVCPNTEICPVYKNWVEQTKDTRLDIIQKISRIPEYGRFGCLAFGWLRESRAKNLDNKELGGRAIGTGCSYILILNICGP